MIIDAFLSPLFSIMNLILSPLEALQFDFDPTKINGILQYFKMALYIIPIKELYPILAFFVAMMNFRIIISLLKTLWDIIPLL